MSIRIFIAAILGAYRLTPINLDRVNGKCGVPNCWYVKCESTAAPATVKYASHIEPDTGLRH